MSNEDSNSRSSRYKKRKNKNTRKQSGGILKKVLLVIVFVVLLLLIAGAGLFTYYAASAPDLTDDDLYGTYSSELVDRNGDVFYTVGSETRDFASANEYPQVLEDAVLSIEDQRFYNHNGIDPIGIGRAGLGYVTEGQIVGGGSTITQQLIKLSVFSTLREDQTLERKAQEAWLAIQLEQDLSKEQILTLYMNRVHMAGNVYGMGTAAQEYYGKHVSELELHEAAMLAGMPQAPNRNNPYNNPNVARNRRDTVLQAMYDNDKITRDEFNQATALPADEGLVDQPETVDEDELYLDGYISAVLDEVYEQTDYNPYTAGLTIHTNIDLDIQRLMYDTAHSEEYIDPDDELQTALTLMDPKTGELLGIVGGRNLDGHLSLNRATDNSRNVGSTIKPLTAYGPAIEFDQRSTYEQVVDEDYTVPGTDYNPQNWDNEYHGQMTTRQALVTSRNIPAVKVLNEDSDPSQVNGFLEGLGIDPAAMTGSNGVVPSSAIDGSMTPVQLAGAYSAFANGGNYTQPYTVNKIESQSGEEIDTRPETTKAMEDYTAYMITDMLKGVIDYYGGELEVPGFIHAGKTGTTNYTTEQLEENGIPRGQGLVPDSWFVGYSPKYAMSAWVGYDQHLEPGNQLSTANGKRQLPRHFYREIMTVLAQESDSPDWEQPDSVEEIEVIDGSDPARLPTSSTPESDLITELFVEGNTPYDTVIPPSDNDDEIEEEIEEEPEEDTENENLEEDTDESEESDEDEETDESDETNDEDTDTDDEEETPTPPENGDNDNSGGNQPPNRPEETEDPENSENDENSGNNGNRPEEPNPEEDNSGDTPPEEITPPDDDNEDENSQLEEDNTDGN